MTTTIKLPKDTPIEFLLIWAMCNNMRFSAVPMRNGKEVRG